MKKILSFALVLALLLTTLQVSASDSYFYSNGTYKISGHVIGTCEMEEIVDSDADNDAAYYNLTIDTNSTIIFDTLLDTLSIEEPEKEGRIYFEFKDGEVVSDGTCTVNYSTAFRKDSAESYALEVDLENEVEYIKENAGVRFNEPGNYTLFATLGAADGYDRISQLIKTVYRGDTYYSLPGVVFMITVIAASSSESFGDAHYDENVFSVSGITGYDEKLREEMDNNIVALCTSPVTITASNDLINMSIVKLENIDGRWVETRFFDGFAINMGDITKNWCPAEGFEDTYEDCFEFTGGEDALDEENMTVKKGTSISIVEPGVYSVWGDSYSGDYTGIVLKIGDSIASYTNSKVMVDGKDVKFEAYNINGNNYFKLRDIAYALSNYGTGGKVFDVKWDGERNMISLITGLKYESVGGELADGDGKDKSYKLSTSALIKDGKGVTLTAYNINGNNYFKLRDLGKLFDFGIAWDGANNCILIDSGASYIE